MIVSSSIELYTTVLGWFMFNSLWDLLTGTGVALIPFAFIVIRNLIEARKSRDKTDIGVQAFARSEIELYVAFFVLILCCNPAINLAPQSVRANIHQCEVNGDSLTQTTQEIRIGQTGTTYDRIDALELDGRTPKVPIIWYIWDFFSSGLSTTAAGILPCQPDLRRISTELATLQIHDKQLRDETAMFYRDCWRPSLNRYLRDKPPVPQEIKDIDQDIMGPAADFFSDTAVTTVTTERPRACGASATTVTVTATSLRQSTLMGEGFPIAGNGGWMSPMGCTDGCWIISRMN